MELRVHVVLYGSQNFVFVILLNFLQDHEVDLDSLAKLLAKYIRDWFVNETILRNPVYF